MSPAGGRPVLERLARGRDDRGLVLPSWLVVVCAVVTTLAVVGFAVSGDRDPRVAADDASAPASSDPTGGAGERNGTGRTDPAGRGDGDGEPSSGTRPDPVERRTAYVDVYNNSGVTGLAASKAATLQDTGWRVGTTDNWYGEIPADTVYYPAGLAAQAELLAADLGIDRTQPAIEPMQFDRLTLILVSGT